MAEIDFKADSFVVVICLWGVDLNINGMRVRCGETMLVPACEKVIYIR